MVTVKKQESIEVLPEGNYNAILEKWSPVRKKEYMNKETNEMETKEFIDALWRVQDGLSQGKLIKDNFGLYLSDNSDLGKFVNKFTEGVKVGENFDLDKLLGIKAQLTLNVEEKTSKTGGKFKVNKIVSRIKV